MGAAHLPVYPAGASAGTDGGWWGCVIGICVAQRGGNTPGSFPLTSQRTYTHTRTRFQTPITACHSFSTNCPPEYTFYWGRLLHRLRVNMCLQDYCAGFSPGCRHEQEPLVDGKELKIQAITFSAEVPFSHCHCCFTQPMRSPPISFICLM